MAEENIFLFVPNLIGYARIVLALLAFYLMPCCPVPAVFFYLLSALLDAFDGHAARALNQGTKFGAMLDMLTDRCATMCLLVNLALLYPSYTFLFQISMSLDIASHWLHLHSSMMKGSTSHKAIDLSGNPILRLYYTSRADLTAVFHSRCYLSCVWGTSSSSACSTSPTTLRNPMCGCSGCFMSAPWCVC
ncbi:CDP-diacylglycerol--inositol 3-phosphatidyltransferase isoform X2 [Salmo salar]|uniref:CDP-diacylglycerol--inositol 3-phosphatidyltransferase isoform X2 n=1 Tax=Salmo salar TaxID=8030 RepID=A0ABM3EII8_SALSA|nr:CDP-diacylglycerol--inositol 3-phosphatidyltransferase isoform X2 [Salmo salar]